MRSVGQLQVEILEQLVFMGLWKEVDDGVRGL